MKFEIKNRFDGSIIFSIETETIKLAVEAAIKSSADLSYADLSYAHLSSADLSYANLRSASLRSANLRSANLSSADLRYANLSYANLSYADLRYAHLRYANLRSANLRSAHLRYAHLRYADLRYADLRYAVIADNINVTKAPLQIFGLAYPITIWDAHMHIGCQFHSLAEWDAFTDEEIVDMDGKNALKFWRAHKSPIFAIAKSDDRVPVKEESNVAE